MAIESLLSTLPGIIQMLPVMLEASQLFFYIFFIWFFGSMSMKGFRGKRPFFLRIAGTLLTGSLCLLASASFAGFLPFISSGIFSVLQIDMIVAGILVSLLFAAAISMMTHDKSAWRPEETVEILRRKVSVLEEMLRTNARHLTEAGAKKAAEEALKGYKALSAKLVGNDYDVKMKKGGRDAEVILDAWDGEIKKKIMHESCIVSFFSDPKKVAGLLVFVAVTAAAVAFFEGFPNPAEQMTSMLGIDMNELGNMAGSLSQNPLINSGSVPEGCVSPLIFAGYTSQFQDNQFVLDHIYSDEGTKKLIESKCGPVRMMLKINHEGKDVIIGFTTDAKFAYLTDGRFCMCIDTSSMQ